MRTIVRYKGVVGDDTFTLEEGEHEKLIKDFKNSLLYEGSHFGFFMSKSGKILIRLSEVASISWTS